MSITESKHRLYEKLHHDLGENILNYLLDKMVNEIMLNPDGCLWIDTMKTGMLSVGKLEESKALAIIQGIAGIHQFIVNQHHPRLEAELPMYGQLRGERFTALVPPVVSHPSFTIRKKSETVFLLDDYVASNRLLVSQADVLRSLIKARKNILVCGGPGSGKTTLTNALIAEAVSTDKSQRFLILEDLPELQCSAPNQVAMLTTNDINMTALLRAAMRLRPDRILIGEVRGFEALDMLKAWNTGCPGGICTVHANSAKDAIQRICDLTFEAGLIHPPTSLILQTIDAVVFVTHQNHQKGFIKNILSIEDYFDEKFVFKTLA